MKSCTVCGAEWPDDTKFCPNDGSTLRTVGAEGEMVGSVVADRYHIEKKLGEGGMGAVYLGEHVKMGRKSAIKVMSQSMASDPEAIARFNREAANAARINHPNVCGIYDFGETPDGTIYLAMEFIEGRSLDDLLHVEGALSPARAVSILRQTADALHAAHDLGIVHRDLKPDNIMLASGRDGSDVVKVVDFGIAKAMGGEEGQNVTKTGLVVGTPEYMSPEQLSGDKLDGRSDIYSLALVFYRMVTGGLPFQADTAQETMIKRLTDDPLPMKVVLPSGNFPDALQVAVDRGLSRMPGERYGNASEFATDVERAIKQMPTEQRMVRQSATQMIDSTALDTEGATALLPKTEIAGHQAAATPSTPAPAPAAPQPEEKKKPVLAIVAAAVIVFGGGGTAVVMMGGSDDTSPVNGNGGGPPVENVTENTAGTEGATQVSGLPSGDETPTTNPGVSQPAGREEAPALEGGAPTTQPTGEAVEPQPAVQLPAIDSAGLDDEFFAYVMDDVIEESASRRLEVRGRAIEIADDDRVPMNIRVQAATLAGNAFEADFNTTEACRWYSRAVSFDADYRPAQLGLASAGCQ